LVLIQEWRYKNWKCVSEHNFFQRDKNKVAFSQSFAS